MKLANSTLVHLVVGIAVLLSGCASLPGRLTSPDKSIRDAAFEELMTSTEIGYGEAESAVATISDPIERRKLATKAKSYRVRKVAVSEITDQDLLQAIANNKTESAIVRSEAVSQIENESILKGFSKNDADTIVRLAAIRKISDFTYLKELSRTAKTWREYTTIAGRINDSEVFAEMTKAEKWRREAKNEYGRSRLEAMIHLRGGRDDDVLGIIATEDYDDSVRLAAIQKLEDQELLKKAAIADRERDNRLAAIGKLNNQKVLQDVVYRARIRWAASGQGYVEFKEYLSVLERITDSPTLRLEFSKILLNVDDMDAWPLRDLSSRLTDRDLTELVLMCMKYNRHSPFVQDAISHITNQELLGKIALNKGHAGRELPIPRLTDVSLLTELASPDEEPGVRSTAKKRLGELAFQSGGSDEILKAARGEFGKEAQCKVLSRPNIAKEVYAIAFKGFLTRDGDGAGVDINLDEEIIRKCPYDDLVQWVASHWVVSHDRGYWDQRHAKEELIRRGLYSKDQFDKENRKHDAISDILQGGVIDVRDVLIANEVFDDAD